MMKTLYVPSIIPASGIYRQTEKQSEKCELAREKFGAESEQDDIIGPTGIVEGFSLVASKLRSEE